MAHQVTRQNLDDVFRQVLNGDLAWSSRDEFTSAMTAMTRQLSQGSIDWDDGAGEEWGRVLEGEQLVANVLARGRVAFIDERYSALADVLPRPKVVQVVSDWDDEVYEVDEHVLRQAFDRGSLPSDVNYGSVSASDLWWATV